MLKVTKLVGVANLLVVVLDVVVVVLVMEVVVLVVVKTVLEHFPRWTFSFDNLSMNFTNNQFRWFSINSFIS